MKDWMGSLAWHYKNKKTQYQGDKLIIVFDIDGTILDMRFLILHVLRKFDKKHGTKHFKGLKISDIDFHETNIGCLLDRLSICREDQDRILSKYDNLLISSTAVMEAHRPFRGVLDVIRWFQLQPNTFVGLNTGRPESLRINTLMSLNRLAREYRVLFRNDLLFMKPSDSEENITAAKVRGIEYFQGLGYKVFAVVDNEPENLQAISRRDPEREILLLHADTIFQSRDVRITGNAVSGKEYSISKLISQKNLPKHIQFVWQWNGTMESLHGFLMSHIKWMEIGPGCFKTNIDRNGLHNKEYTLFRECIGLLKDNNKKIKINLSENTFFSGNMPGIIKECGIDDSRLWFYGNMHEIGPEGYRALRRMYPGAIIGCPVDILSTCVSHYPLHAKEILKIFRSWGINRFSINWRIPGKRVFFNQLRQWGMEVDIYNTSNLESFLQAVLLLPDSITMNLDFALKNEGNDVLTERFSDDDSTLRKIA
jgi:hypothetical protein